MQLWSGELRQKNVDPLIIGDVETIVMDMNTPVHVAINPGEDPNGIKDAVPPVQTAVSNTKMVKRLSF